MVRIGLADSCPLIRQALKEILRNLAAFTLAWETELGCVAQFLKKDPIPFLVLEPFGRRNPDALSLIGRLRRDFPATRLLVYTHALAESFPLSALRAGASGVLAKECPVVDLVTALRTVASGKTYLSPDQSEQLSLRFLLNERARTESDILAPREEEVLAGIAAGKRLKEIAGDLFLSAKTVHTYKTRIMERFHLKSNADLIRFAQQRDTRSA